MKYQALYPLEIQFTRNAIFYTSQKGLGQFSMKEVKFFLLLGLFFSMLTFGRMVSVLLKNMGTVLGKKSFT